MKRNALLLILCALIAAFFFWDQKSQEKKTEREEKEKIVIPITSQEVKEVTIIRDGVTMKGIKEGDQWKLIEPLQVQGDKSTFDSICTTIAGSKRQNVIEKNPSDLGIFGIRNSLLKVTVAGINGATASTMIFGKESPVAGNYYALISGTSEVITVPSAYQSTVAKSLFDLRDKTVVALDENKVQKIQIENNFPPDWWVKQGKPNATPNDAPKAPSPAILNTTGTYVLERKGTDEWSMVQPVTSLANESAVKDFVLKFKNAKVKQFVEEKPDFLDMYGLSNPGLKISFWSGDSPTGTLAAQTLLIGATSESGDYYAKYESQKNIFTVGWSDLEKVPANVDSLRMKKVTSIRSWEVKELKVSAAGKIIMEATKGEGDWTLLQPVKGKANYDSISQVVRALTDLEASGFVQDASEFATPEYEIELKSDSKKASFPIFSKKGADASKEYFAKRLNPVELLKLKQDAVEKMLSDIAAVKPDQPSGPPQDVTKEEKPK